MCTSFGGKILRVFCGITLSGAVLFFFQGLPPLSAEPPSEEKALIAQGEADYQQACTSCHEAKAPTLHTAAEWKTALESTGCFVETVNLTPEQRKGILAYLSTQISQKP